MSEKLTEQAARGMTVNERLFAAELMDAFYQAVARRDRTELQCILKQIYVSLEDADVIIDRVLQAPRGTA
jgi:hypothetical protein